MRFLPALLLLCVASTAAHAERYRVDLIVFLDKGGMSTELPKPFVPPDLTGALEPDAKALAGTSIELIPDNAFGLPEVWQRLRNSRRYQPLVKLAWMQTDPSAERSLPLHVHQGLPLTIQVPVAAAAPAPGSPAMPTTFQTVDGTIALRLSRYLFLDVDLHYTQPLPDGRPASFHLKEVRKMRRDELHYLDSPRLGVVAKVTKASILPAASVPPPGPASPTAPAPPSSR